MDFSKQTKQNGQDKARQDKAISQSSYLKITYDNVKTMLLVLFYRKIVLLYSCRGDGGRSAVGDG